MGLSHAEDEKHKVIRGSIENKCPSKLVVSD